jgi:glycosyltransferase involved in cell wall biosynthesis
MHVGIMPLPHGAWEYGKSSYKLVQYMAASRPVIASPVRVNCDVVKEGVNGFFAITEAEWLESRTISWQCDPDRRIRRRARDGGDVVFIAGDLAQDRRAAARGGNPDTVPHRA